MAITRINTFEAAPDKTPALRAFLTSAVGLIRIAPGCRSVELLIGAENPRQMAILEVWDTIAAHQASVARIPPALLKQARELLAAPPGGGYYESVMTEAGQ